jgi:drug/metabolite transporter (DMT)-like permease
LPGALGHSLVAWSHRHVHAWLGSLITQCQPVVATVAAWILLGEPITVAAVVGGAVVLASTAAVLLGARGRIDADPFDEPESPAPAG